MGPLIALLNTSLEKYEPCQEEVPRVLRLGEQGRLPWGWWWVRQVASRSLAGDKRDLMVLTERRTLLCQGLQGREQQDSRTELTYTTTILKPKVLSKAARLSMCHVPSVQHCHPQLFPPICVSLWPTPASFCLLHRPSCPQLCSCAFSVLLGIPFCWLVCSWQLLTCQIPTWWHLLEEAFIGHFYLLWPFLDSLWPYVLKPSFSSL